MNAVDTIEPEKKAKTLGEVSGLNDERKPRPLGSFLLQRESKPTDEDGNPPGGHDDIQDEPEPQTPKDDPANLTMPAYGRGEDSPPVRKGIFKLLSVHKSESVQIITEAMEIPQMGCLVRSTVVANGTAVSLQWIPGVRIIPDVVNGQNVGNRLWGQDIQAMGVDAINKTLDRQLSGGGF